MKARTILIISILIIAGISIVYTGADDLDADIDYRDSNNWVSLPNSTPYDVDVFYVYPTVSSDSSGTMDIKDLDQRALATGIFKVQAGIFDSCANVFAPYYRQMTTAVDVSGGLATDTEGFKKGSADVDSAFRYFISELNDDRPFFLAGHSQGTMALIELIKNHFGNDKELRERLIAAYLIGYTVTPGDLSIARLKAAQKANDVGGVVISYNTQSPTSEGGPMLMDSAICINPLNWRTDNLFADSTKNLGAVFFDDENGKFILQVEKYCSAEIDSSGALIARIPENDSVYIGPYTEGVYHRYDFAFWYRNLQKNVLDRISAFHDK